MPRPSEDDDLVPCPNCKARIYEDSERCPECGYYLSEEDVPSSRPLWIVLGTVAALAVALLWALGL